MQKVDGVEKVRVSLQDGLTVLDLKPNNSVTIAQLRQIIKNNGFVSKEIQIAAAGEPSVIEGKPGLIVAGTGERLPAIGPPQPNGDMWTFTVPPPR